MATEQWLIVLALSSFAGIVSFVAATCDRSLDESDGQGGGDT